MLVSEGLRRYLGLDYRRKYPSAVSLEFPAAFRVFRGPLEVLPFAPWVCALS